MNYLLDTHVFVWFNGEPKRLSKTALETITDAENDVFISLISIWEMQIKLQLGKLKLPDTIPVILQKQADVNHIALFPLRLAHILELQHLQPHHRDPFDRLLVAQARIEDMVLITHDTDVRKYDIETLW